MVEFYAKILKTSVDNGIGGGGGGLIFKLIIV